MHYFNKSMCALIVFVLGFTGLYAQETIIPCGGTAIGSGGSASYSIGQIAYITASGANGSAAQGVQQPFEISVINGIDELNGISLECITYPIPATDHIVLKIEGVMLKDFSYQLLDLNGNLIDNKIIVAKESDISIEKLTPAVYFLKVTKNSKEVKYFKIIKN